MSSAEAIWAAHLEDHTRQVESGRPAPPPPRPGDWWCPVCWPKVNNFATKNACYRCGALKPPKGSPLANGPPERTPGIKIGIRGDSLLQTRHDTAKKTKKRNFHHELNSMLYEVFGNCTIDHELSAGENLYEVTRAIANGPGFDVLSVGVGVQDLVDPNDYSKIVPVYPSWLDDTLRMLAAAIMTKSKHSMVWVGGPAEFWGRQKQWDTYMEKARQTLRDSGVQVVPRETVNWVMNQMKLSNDGMSISNINEDKEIFSKCWSACLHAAATEPSWGLAPDAAATEEVAGWASSASQAAGPGTLATWQQEEIGILPVASGGQGSRARSRSPPPLQATNLFAAFGYTPMC